MSTPLILCCNLPPERAARVKTLCVVHKLRVRTVAPTEYGEPIGALAGLLPPTGTAAPAPVPQEEMLVFCNLPEQALQAFLSGYRKAGLPPIPLKAVLTPTNVSWSAAALCEELKKEHAAMTSR